MYKLKILGSASNSLIKIITVSEQDDSKTILELLQENEIPVASSCMGEGVCERCIINDSVLSCLSLVSEIMSWDKKEISIAYL